MTFDDIAEVAELERQYSRNPWDATGLFAWWLRDDTLFLVAGEEEAATEQPSQGEAAAENFSSKEADEGKIKLEETASVDLQQEEEEASSDEASDEDYVPPVVYGYVGLVLIPYESDITNITVSGECRRQGIATRLMEELFRRCPEKGVTVVHLEVRESNESARALYKKLGFVEDGRRKRYYTDPVEDAILMTKNLAEGTVVS